MIEEVIDYFMNTWDNLPNNITKDEIVDDLELFVVDRDFAEQLIDQWFTDHIKILNDSKFHSSSSSMQLIMYDKMVKEWVFKQMELKNG